MKNQTLKTCTAGTMLAVEGWPFSCCSFDLWLLNRSFTAQRNTA